MKKKYELFKKEGNLWRIKRISDGRMGGLIESEDNLSHEGSCFVYENARVTGNARILDDAIAYGCTEISGHAVLSESSSAYGKSKITQYAKIYGNAKVYGSATISGHSEIYDEACAFESCNVTGNSKIFQYARVLGRAIISHNAEVSGYTVVDGIAEIRFEVKSNTDFFVIGELGKGKPHVTVNIPKKKVVCGSFYGTFKEFEQYINNKYKRKVKYHSVIEMLKDFLSKDF